MDKSVVYFAKHDGLVVLKLVGEFAFSLDASKALNAFIDEVLTNEEYENILIDLSETESLDSTNLGLLAILTRITMDLYDRKATIISTDDDINEILDSVGFPEVFHIVHDPHNPDAEWEKLPEAEATGKELTRVVLNAHRELLDLNDKNKDMFQDVVDLLEREVEKDT